MERVGHDDAVQVVEVERFREVRDPGLDPTADGAEDGGVAVDGDDVTVGPD
jgi:hypothetical protein